MKWSKYNIFLNNDVNTSLLFNTFTQRVLVLQNELCEIIKDNISRIECLSTIHNDLYQYLVGEKFIINDSDDEVSNVINSFINQEKGDYFHLIINPM